MTAMRTALLAAPAVVAVLAVCAGVALQHHTPQQLPGTIANSHVVLADATDDNNDWVQQQEQDQLQEQLALQEMVQSEQAAEQQNEMAQQEAQQAEQQGMMVEQQANQ
jgi:hypothetical protein